MSSDYTNASGENRGGGALTRRTFAFQLRHTAIRNVYRATKDLYLTQRFARHASPLTRTAYTSDEELHEAMREFVEPAPRS